MNEFLAEPTERRYHLRCKIQISRINVHDVKPDGSETQFDREVVYLVPEKNDQGISFFNTWLPDINDPTPAYEIAMYIAGKVDSPCRGAVSRKNAGCQEHHIYVMSKGVEEQIVNENLHGQSVNVKVLGEGEENEADQARDSGGDYDAFGPEM